MDSIMRAGKEGEAEELGQSAQVRSDDYDTLRAALVVIAHNLIEQGSKAQLDNQLQFAIRTAKTALRESRPTPKE